MNQIERKKRVFLQVFPRPYSKVIKIIFQKERESMDAFKRPKCLNLVVTFHKSTIKGKSKGLGTKNKQKPKKTKKIDEKSMMLH